jgi:hypothetical protein
MDPSRRLAAATSETAPLPVGNRWSALSREQQAHDPPARARASAATDGPGALRLQVLRIATLPDPTVEGTTRHPVKLRKELQQIVAA